MMAVTGDIDYKIEKLADMNDECGQHTTLRS